MKAALAALVLLASACTAATPEESASDVEPVVTVRSGPTYAIDLDTLGAEPRFVLREPVPVDRSVEAAVELQIGDDVVFGTLIIFVVDAPADGSQQQLSAELTGVSTFGGITDAGLGEAMGFRATLTRDDRGSVIDWQPEFPTTLSTRSQAIMDLIVEAPFAFAGPLPREAIGAGSTWQVAFDGEAATDADLRYELVGWTGDEYEIGFESGLTEGRLVGRPGDLIPSFQTYDNGTNRITVTATRR